MKGGKELKEEVQDKGFCTLCGLCVGRCPYIKSLEDKIAVVFPCDIEEGKCYAACPRTFTDWDAVEGQILGDVDGRDPLIGRYTQVWMARGTNPELIRGTQDGGTVTTLIRTAMAEGMIEGAVLTATSDGLAPQAALITEADQIGKTSGSKYIAATSLQALHQARRAGLDKVGIVGRPCQVMGIRKYQTAVPEECNQDNTMVIGLFCMWALSYGFRDYVRQEAGDQEVTGIAIPKGELQIKTVDGTITKSVEEAKQFARSACNLCWDVTSELADISVGAAEFAEGWNTLIVRSERGWALLGKALKAGVLEIKEYPPAMLEELRMAALGKKRRVVAELTRIQSEGASMVDLASPRFQCVNEGEVN
ncbi:MAG: Coenzyme F420 hydrogenase/dehydrogenase, beta subunit C-terminal domain [Syntrophomonadales bacterium]|jgi:coenzyme F420 hydrogenase subunit beta